MMLTTNEISSLVIDALCDQAYGQDTTVLYLYCDYQAQKAQSPESMIGCLLVQVVREAMLIRGEILGDIRSTFNESKKRGGRGSQGLELPDMLQLFVKAISSIGRVYICVDAIDELLPRNRSEFLHALQQIIQDAPNARLFLTGRPHIRPELDRHLTKGAYIIDMVAGQGDIARYVTKRIDFDNYQYPDSMTENLKNDVVETISEKVSGT